MANAVYGGTFGSRLTYFPAIKAAVVAVGEEKIIREAVAPFGIPLQVLQ